MQLYSTNKRKFICIYLYLCDNTVRFACYLRCFSELPFLPFSVYICHNINLIWRLHFFTSSQYFIFISKPLLICISSYTWCSINRRSFMINTLQTRTSLIYIKFNERYRFIRISNTRICLPGNTVTLYILRHIFM